MPEHILSVSQFDRPYLENLFERTHKMKELPRASKLLDGYILGNLFFEASTRSRMSFTSAFLRLGGTVNSTTGVTFSSMAKGETLADTISVIQSYCDVLVMRHHQLGSAGEAAKHSSVPLINAGDGPGEHPTQALLDLYTILDEKKRMDNFTIAMVGDLKYGRTVHSLAVLLSLCSGINFIFVAPDSLQIPDSIRESLEKQGCSVTRTDNLKHAAAEADIIYTTRIQKERFTNLEEFEKVDGYFILDRQKVSSWCRPDVTILHPLPRTNEITTDVDELPNAAYFRQAQNGLYVRMALFLTVLDK